LSLLGELIDVLSRFTVDDVLHFEEMYDEQFHALRYLYSKSTNNDVFIALVLMNSTVSYQLSCSGERWWWEFARYFSDIKSISLEKLPEKFAMFLSESRCGGRLRQQKLSRIRRAWSLIRLYAQRLEWLIKNQKTFTIKLARTLNASVSAKTIVFTAKMLNYALRIVTKQRIVAPMELDIPLDSRIRAISKALCIEDPLTFWRELSRKLRIPPLHLDSLLWVGFRLAEDPSIIEKFIGDRKLAEYIEVMRKIREAMRSR